MKPHPHMKYIKTGLELPKEIQAVQMGRHVGDNRVPVMNPEGIGLKPNGDAPGQPKVPLPDAAFDGDRADKYHGEVAENYDDKRKDQVKNAEEQLIIELMLDELTVGNWVLDCPIGTGRFLSYYNENGLLCRGIDKSQDMLQKAAAKVACTEGNKVPDQHVSLAVGDVRNLEGVLPKSVDAALMIRLTRWLSPEDCIIALVELMRCARRKVIFTARVKDHQHARGYDLILKALEIHGEKGEAWEISKDVGLPSDENYRVIELAPC